MQGLLRVGGAVEPEPVPRDDDPQWVACHAKLQEYIKHADEPGQGFGVLFYGDSITESWVGTDMCRPCPRCAGVPAVFERHWGRYHGGVAAIGNDQSAHLMWRLAHGEVPLKNQPKVVVLLIGTNDLGAAAGQADVHTQEEAVIRAVPGVTLRVLKTLHMLRDALPNSHIILLALLPRGGGGPAPAAFHWPSVFTQPLEMVNQHFSYYTRLDGRLHFLDCGDRFLTPDHRAIDPALMPEGLHPNAAGYELLAECIDPMLVSLMQKSSSGAGGGGSGSGGDVADVAK